MKPVFLLGFPELTYLLTLKLPVTHIKIIQMADKNMYIGKIIWIHHGRYILLCNKLAKPFFLVLQLLKRKKSLNLSVGSHAYTKGSKEFSEADLWKDSRRG